MKQLTLTAIVGLLIGFSATTGYHLMTDPDYWQSIRTEMASFLS